MTSRSQGNSTWTGSSKASLAHARNELKRISGITDLQRLETLGANSDDNFGLESEQLPDDMLARRAQMLGTISSYSVYQLSEATEHNQYVEC